MGCHTEGLKTFEDQIRLVVERTPNLSDDRAQALRLYAEKPEMDILVREDVARYREALEAAGGIFGGTEPIQQLVKQFEGPLNAAAAAAEVGLLTSDFRQKIRERSGLQRAGLTVLDVPNGSVKRDAWASQFGAVISALNLRGQTGMSDRTPTVTQPSIIQSRTRQPTPGTSRSAASSPSTDMVLIPAGSFQMGSTTGELDEKPVHTVYVDAFYMDTYEVTNAQYKKFIDANPQWRKDQIPRAYHNGFYLNHWNGNTYPVGKANHPVVYVSWYAAMAYAKWAGKRLPTEAEWEKAARGGLRGKKYPWGDSIDSNQANFGNNVKGTTAVGMYPANGYGLYDMAGNVWEWCIDEYDSEFYGRSPRQNPISGASIARVIANFTSVKINRVLRGGPWSWTAPYVRVASRFGNTPSLTLDSYGFRCVRAVSP